MNQVNQNSEHKSQAASELVEQGNDLLKHAISAFEMEAFEPVQMAFPNVIGGSEAKQPGDFATNVNRLFAEQEKLFGTIPSMEQEPQPVVQIGADIEHYSQPGAQIDAQCGAQANILPGIESDTQISSPPECESQELQAIRAMYESG